MTTEILETLFGKCHNVRGEMTNQPVQRNMQNLTSIIIIEHPVFYAVMVGDTPASCT